MARLSLLLGFSVLTSACGGAAPPPESPSSEEGDLSQTAVQSEEGALSTATETDAAPTPEAPTLVAAMPPTECAEGSACEPPQAFARAVCQGRFPGLAVALFEKSTPWERRYVKVESIEPVNTYGGTTTSERLTFTEEVLILHRQSGGQSSGGIQVSGASDVDVLRWDGTCVTVREEYLSVHQMPTIRNATVTWKYLDEAIQKGLLAAKYVNLRYTQQRTACRNSSAARPDNACQKATEKLNDAITVAIRGGIDLPDPGELPIWKPAE